MKKIITVILLFALIVPAGALSADPDPVTLCCWYMDLDMETAPELGSAYPNYRRITAIYIFDPSGALYCLENDISIDGTADFVNYGPAGKWEAAAGGYTVSLIGFGEGKGHIENGELLCEMYGTKGIYFRLRPLVKFDFYKDLVYAGTR